MPHIPPWAGVDAWACWPPPHIWAETGVSRTAPKRATTPRDRTVRMGNPPIAGTTYPPPAWQDAHIPATVRLAKALGMIRNIVIVPPQSSANPASVLFSEGVIMRRLGD